MSENKTKTKTKELDDRVIIPVDPLRIIGSMERKESKIDKNILEFLASLSFEGYILAGNSVANMIENVEIKGDLDFWVLANEDDYYDILEEFAQKNPVMFDIYPSMIEMKIPNLPLINLIFSEMIDAEDTVNSFDFDYCRCYYTNETGCMASEVSLASIKTKTICHD